MNRLRPRDTVTAEERRAFFDSLARSYADYHDSSGNGLRRRVRLLVRLLRPSREQHVLEVGCGTGDHLFELLPYYGAGTGVDFSDEMIRVARERRHHDAPVSLRVDEAERLATVPSSSIDAVFCVGVIEHVPDLQGVFRAVARVLKDGGTFVCLTINGDYLWYRLCELAGRPVTHLSSDTLPTRRILAATVEQAGFRSYEMDSWSFVPSGDTSRPTAAVLRAADVVGSLAGLKTLRGGLWIRAGKQAGRTDGR